MFFLGEERATSTTRTRGGGRGGILSMPRWSLLDDGELESPEPGAERRVGRDGGGEVGAIVDDEQPVAFDHAIDHGQHLLSR
ncbi:MAG: hypothetical protein R3F65_14725 [bacterium]